MVGLSILSNIVMVEASLNINVKFYNTTWFPLSSITGSHGCSHNQLQANIFKITIGTLSQINEFQEFKSDTKKLFVKTNLVNQAIYILKVSVL